MILRYFNFIPVYNNPNTVLDVVLRTLKSSTNPLLLIDDGSKEPVSKFLGKNELVKKALSQKKIFFSSFSKNKGKGAALKKAIRWGVSNNFSHMITIDADGQFNPEEINSLQTKSSENPWDYVLGERIFKEGTPSSSIFGRSFSNMWVKLETGLQLPDTQTGFRCYPLFWVQNISSFRNRFAFEIELIVKGLWLGAGAQSVSVNVIYPKDRISHFKKIRDNFSLSLLHSQLCFLRVLSIIFCSKKQKSWSGKQSKSSKTGTLIFTYFIRFSGIKTAYFLLIFVSLFYYIFNFSARKGLSDYWKNIRPGINFFPLQLNIFLNIYRFGQSLIDLYYINAKPEVQQEILNNFNDIQLNANVLFSGHFGYWNLAASLFRQYFNKEISTLEYIAPQQNFEENTYGEKHRNTISISPDGDSIFSFHGAQRSKQTTAGLVDRPTGDRYELVRFFNKLTPIDTSLGRAAVIMKSDIAFFVLTKKSINTFKFKLHYPKNTIDKKKIESTFLWATEFSKFYEEAIKETPHSWANFYTPWKVHPSFAKPQGLKRKESSRKNKTILLNPFDYD